MRPPSTRPTTFNITIDVRAKSTAAAESSLLERMRRRFKHPKPSEDISFPSVIYMQPAAPWLPIVEQRIENSVLPAEYSEHRKEACESGEWLEENVAHSALSFFRSQADILPSEPFIYASRAGDLVAEFEGAKGRLTTIVGPNDVTFFAVSKGKPVETTMRRWSNSLRERLNEFRALIAD